MRAHNLDSGKGVPGIDVSGRQIRGEAAPGYQVPTAITVIPARGS
jgi:hypothetical protein